MLAWPHVNSDWQATLSNTDRVYCELTRHISRFERVLIVYYNDVHRGHIQSLLEQQAIPSSRLIWCQARSNDSWARDFGPITVTAHQQPMLLDFQFNGWGNKYPAELDNQITRRLNDNGCFGKNKLRTIPFILEGGAIDCDGEGTLLTTTACLLNPSRNPSYNQNQIETLLSETLGVDRILWLTQGQLSGDDTDSHIDMLARFCNPSTIAYSHCDDPTDSHYHPLQAMLGELEQFHHKNGKPYQLVALPLPQAIFDANGQRLPASYANFLIINGAVLMPTYNDPADAIALQRLQDCFPDRQIIAIDCLPLIQQYGSLHCATMQLPEGVLAEEIS